jgi:hypothetical protein
MVIWACYRFSFSSLGDQPDIPYEKAKATLGSVGIPAKVADFMLSLPIPASEFFVGFKELATDQIRGTQSYLLGMKSRTGWWYYYPIALFFKTPLPFLLLSLIGFVYLTHHAKRSHDWRFWSILVCFAVSLTVTLPTRMNIGIRHILILYPCLSMAAGFGAYKIFQSTGKRAVVYLILTGMLCWTFISSIAAHPDYLSYFNEMAYNKPEKVLIVSDLDWGQDLNRLSKTIEEMGINDLYIEYFGTAIPGNHGIDYYRQLPKNEKVYGWIAISIFSLTLFDGYSWLQEYEPVTTVGRTIRLYRIDS